MPTDPIGALITAAAGATPGPLTVATADNVERRRVLAQSGCYALSHKLVTPKTYYTNHGADFAYIAAAYDPALIPALQALQAKAAAFDRLRPALERAVNRLAAAGLPIDDLEGP